MKDKINSFNGPIFIVGMNGSGTTMLADCLNNHPLIFIPRYESKVIPYFSNDLAKYGDLKIEKNFNELLSEFSNTHIFRNLSGNKGPVIIPYDYDMVEDKNLSGIIDLTFYYFAKKQGKFIWGDHSPKYAVCLDVLDKLFPKCKIVHVIRDCRDCCLSFNRRFGQNISRAAFQWKKIIQKARQYGLKMKPGRYFEIKYEELTSNAELNMKNLFDFLELPYNSIVLNSRMPMFQNKNIPNDFMNTIAPNSGKWKTDLSEEQVKNIENIAGDYLEKLNYDIRYYTGNYNIPPLQLLLLQILDKINTGYVNFKNLKGKNRLSRLFRVAISSLKQRKFYEY